MTRHPFSLPALADHTENRIPAVLGLLPGVLACILFCALLWIAPVSAQAKDVSVQEAAALLQSPPGGLLILDVRTPGEFRQGHLTGARNLDFFGGRFDLDVAALPKDRPVLLYCRTGQRSAGALEALEQAGIRNILHMNQGIEAWEKAGLPLEK